MTEINSEEIWKIWQKIQKERPLVHCITNIVTVNDCANILLAAGASPTMAHHPLEAAEVTEGCRSLVCNLGATESLDAMTAAGIRAREIGRPIVLDPVGASGSSYRRKLCLELIGKIHPSCIRGNFSEIRALAADQKTAAGVDAGRNDSVSPETLFRAGNLVQDFAKRTGALVIASGAIDLVSDGERAYSVYNGTPWMARITGCGCMSSALLGAFLAVEGTLESAVSSCAVMGICGEIAMKKTKDCGGGTGTFRVYLMDAVSLLTKKDLTLSAVSLLS